MGSKTCLLIALCFDVLDQLYVYLLQKRARKAPIKL